MCPESRLEMVSRKEPAKKETPAKKDPRDFPVPEHLREAHERVWGALEPLRQKALAWQAWHAGGEKGPEPKQPTIREYDRITRLAQAVQEIRAGREPALESEPSGETSLEQAREILGQEYFFGPEAVETALGFAPEDIPEIPYSPEDLEKAKELKEMLVLRVSHDAEGQPMTMERINEIMASRLSEDEGKLLVSQKAAGSSDLKDDCWYKNEPFFKTASLKTEWKLVSTNFVPGPTSKNYIEQTRALRDHLSGLDALTHEELVECSDAVLSELATLMESDWKQAAQKLSVLQINQNHRRTPAEILYDWTLRFKGTKDRGILDSNWDWSNVQSSGGRLVYVGDADAGGASVRGNRPRYAGGTLGVCSSR